MAIAPSSRKSLVKALWSAAGTGSEAVLPGVIVPDSHVEFVFHLEQTWRMRRVDQQEWRPQPSAFVFAQSHGALRFEAEGATSIVAFRVTPVVASAILKCPIHDLWNESVALRELVGSDSDALCERLSSCVGHERFSILESWIERRLTNWTSEHFALQRLFSRVMFVAGVQAAEPRADGLAELRWMVGEWRGVGQGDPGTSGSERHIDSYLDGKYIRSQGRSVYPKQEKNPKGEIHAQLDLWSYDKARGSIVLRQFDTLSFVGTYVLDKAASGPDRWVLVAESLENVPKGWKARYVFTRKSDDEYHEMLELDSDGKGFQPYVTSRFLKVTS